MIKSSRRESVKRWFLENFDEDSVDSRDVLGMIAVAAAEPGRSDHGNRVVWHSLSDCGNDYIASGGTQPCPPAAGLYQGRFTKWRELA